MRSLARPGVVVAVVLTLLGAAGWTIAVEKEEPVNPLACRLANYKQFQDIALSHLQSIGIKYVFMNVPKPSEVDAVMKRLAEHDLVPLVIRGNAQLSQPDGLKQLAVQLETCERMGVKYMFVSAKRHEMSKEAFYKRLHQAGELAKKHGVTITLETHPDLGTNADVQLETMKQVNHPNIRVNFDSANIHYWNRNREAVTELRKIVDYVATVEIKDHNGKYKTWCFPTLGQGIVDIPGVLKVLKEHGYTGPITMEIEGIEGVPCDQATVKKTMADSAAHLRSLGSFK